MLAIFDSQEHHCSYLCVLKYLFHYYLGRVRPPDEGMPAIDKTVRYLLFLEGRTPTQGHPA